MVDLNDKANSNYIVNAVAAGTYLKRIRKFKQTGRMPYSNFVKIYTSYNNRFTKFSMSSFCSFSFLLEAKDLPT